MKRRRFWPWFVLTSRGLRIGFSWHGMSFSKLLRWPKKI